MQVDLSAVPANLLAEVLNKIPDLELSRTSLTIYQGIYTFSTMADTTNINKLKIDNNDLSLVPAEFLAKGVNRVGEVRVHQCQRVQITV